MVGFSAQREAEIERGRKITQERMARGGDVKGFTQLKKEADEAMKEDEERRKAIIENPETLMDKALRDRAGAEVQDQAQTLHEAVLHLADRQEPIIDFRRQRNVDLLEDETVDTGLAQEVTVNMVKAQAVNQPTPMANEDGQDTENKPLNTTLFADDELSFDRVVLPPDELTPKTTAQAEEASEAMVPSPEDIVREGATTNDANPETTQPSIDYFEGVPELAASWPIPGDIDKRLVEDQPTPKRRGRPPKDSK